jgi:hypothetical protein
LSVAIFSTILLLPLSLVQIFSSASCSHQFHFMFTSGRGKVSRPHETS